MSELEATATFTPVMCSYGAGSVHACKYQARSKIKTIRPDLGNRSKGDYVITSVQWDIDDDAPGFKTAQAYCGDHRDWLLADLGRTLG